MVMFFANTLTLASKNITALHILKNACPCQRGPQSPEHVLQFCLLYREARTEQWPLEATLQEQLWDNMEDLLKITIFTQTTGLPDHLIQNYARTRKRKFKIPLSFAPACNSLGLRYWPRLILAMVS